MSLDGLQFRKHAREALARAKAEMMSDDPDRLRYAALELRFAMEAVTYDRALAFKDQIPPDEYKTWQPRKLMAMLVSIDPAIGQSARIVFAEQDGPGQIAPRDAGQLLGTDTVLTLAHLKAHYDAIGSFLHMPSLDQIERNRIPDSAKLRSHCESVVDLLDGVLSSTVWNSTLGVITSLEECLNEECKQPIHRRMPFGVNSIEVQCFACKAEYKVTSEPDNKTFWEPKQILAPCSNPECSEKMALWPHQVVPGTHWRCRGCGTHSGITLSVERVQYDGDRTEDQH